MLQVSNQNNNNIKRVNKKDTFLMNFNTYQVENHLQG